MRVHRCDEMLRLRRSVHRDNVTGIVRREAAVFVMSDDLAVTLRLEMRDDAITKRACDFVS